MKYTLLELTQAVLSSMDSDEINSINDTVESQQVVEVIKSVYDDVLSRGSLRTNHTLFNLVPSNDITKPTLMQKPEGIDKIEWLKYDGQKDSDTMPNWQLVKYTDPESFIDMMHQYNPTEINVGSFTQTFETYDILFNYKNDTAPVWYTSFEDDYIIFDAYDSAVEATLQRNKTIGYGTKVSDFVKEDTYVPSLQPQQFALLLNESKSLAWAELKQVAHVKAESMARKNWSHLQKTRQQIPSSDVFDGGNHNFDKLPNFARRR